MRIPFNKIDAPLNVGTPAVPVLRINSANVKTAAEPIFQQDSQGAESPSLETRVRELRANMIDLSPDEIDQETDACELQLTQLLAQVKSIKFANAFPIVTEFEGGSR